jgi:hypothetical protein
MSSPVFGQLAMRRMLGTAALLLAACNGNDRTDNTGNVAGSASAAAAGNLTEPAIANVAEPLVPGDDLVADLPGLGHPVGDGARFLCFRFDQAETPEAARNAAAAAIDRLEPEFRRRGVTLRHRVEPFAERETQVAACRAEAPASVKPEQVLLIALAGDAQTDVSLRRAGMALDADDDGRTPAQWVETYLNARLGRPAPAANPPDSP